jgi:hypothetical protein
MIIEDSIYTCIMKNGVTYANLSWTFTYSSNTKTKPTNVKYTGRTCTSTTKTFTN